MIYSILYFQAVEMTIRDQKGWVCQACENCPRYAYHRVTSATLYGCIVRKYKDFILNNLWIKDRI